jgi:hypothetical protein
VSIVKRDFSSTVRISRRAWLARRAAVVRRRLRELGSGDWESLFSGYGPRRDLIGLEVGRVGGAGDARATISLARSFTRVRRSSGVVPCQVAGRIHSSDGRRERAVAVAVNGRIAAVGRSFHLRGKQAESYSVMVPEDSMREGRNRLEVLEVADDGALALLARG